MLTRVCFSRVCSKLFVFRSAELSFRTGDYSLSYPNYSGLDYNATHENSFDRILKDVTWEYVLYSRKHKSLKGEGEGRYGCWFGRAKK